MGPTDLPATTDVLIVGGGHAALCAAIAAREKGVDVVVLEGAPKWIRGGNSRHTRNLRAMHAAPTATLAGAYTAEEYWQDLLRVTEGQTNQELAKLMIDASYDLLNWLLSRGIAFQAALSGTLSLERTNAFFLGGGKGLLNAEYVYAEQLGVKVFYDAWVENIDLRGSRFVGATVKVGDRQQTVTATSAVVASGGFQANEQWMREAWGPSADNFLIRGTPYNTGVVLRNLLEQGADRVGDPTQCHAVAIDARAPKYDGGIVTRLDCVPFSVVVNQAGQRFYDEGEDFWPRRYAIWGRLIADQPQQIAYAIFDQKVVGEFMPSVYPAIQADSLTELANQIEVPKTALVACIEGYNSAIPDNQQSIDRTILDGCETQGITPAKSNWAQRIEGPTYFAYPLRPGITFTYLGLRIDASARVQFDTNPSPNLFAAGEVMAGNILGQGYCAGTGMTIGGVFGRIAGEAAACLTL